MELEISGSSGLDSGPFQENRLNGEPDLQPEYCHYKDEGCEMADSCLNCPFPRCIYDEPGGRQHWRKRLRDSEIDRMLGSEGKGVKELASVFGVSQRTIQRALKNSLKRAKNDTEGKSE